MTRSARVHETDVPVRVPVPDQVRHDPLAARDDRNRKWESTGTGTGTGTGAGTRGFTLLTTLWLVASCGPAVSSIASSTPSGEIRGVVVGGAHVAVLDRPSPGAVHLSLWIDAGSRDAAPPQVATLAAWSAAREGVEVEVLPDGTVFRVTCRTRELARCVGRLAAVLGTREVRRLDEERTHLADARRRAAADEHRRAEEAALEALLGAEAAGFFPLGDADGDARAGDRAVRAFLADHYGPTRALVLAAGEVAEAELASAVEHAFDDLPQALGSREARALASGDRTAVVRTGEANVAAIAVAAGDLEDAASIATSLANSTEGVAARAFEVRGGALMTATRAIEGDPAFTAAELFVLARESEPVAAQIDFDHPERAVSAVGMSWLAGASQPSAPRYALGLVVRPASPRDDGEAERARVDRALEERLRSLASATSSEADAQATLENGARIVARRREQSDEVAIAVRFDAGAAHDMPAFHGRMAVLASSLARSCRELATPVRAVTTAESVTLVARAHQSRFAVALARFARCLSTPLTDRQIDDARIELLGSHEPGRAWSARQLAPGAPGWVSAIGPVEIVRTIPTESVRRMQHALVRGRHIAVGISGVADAGRAVRLASFWLEPLEAGDALAAAEPGAALDAFEVAEWTPELPRVAIGFRASTNGASKAEGAGLFARLLAGALAQESGLRVVDATGGELPGGVFAVVVCDAGEQALADLPEKIRRAREALAERTVEASLERQHLDARIDSASLEAHALRLVEGAGGDDARSALAAFRSLLSAEPHITVARRQP